MASIKHQSLKKHIVNFMGHNEWTAGGYIDRFIHSITGAKESNIGRRCRELKVAGILNADYRQVDDKGPSVVFYRLNNAPANQGT